MNIPGEVTSMTIDNILKDLTPFNKIDIEKVELNSEFNLYSISDNNILKLPLAILTDKSDRPRIIFDGVTFKKIISELVSHSNTIKSVHDKYGKAPAGALSAILSSHTVNISDFDSHHPKQTDKFDATKETYEYILQHSVQYLPQRCVAMFNKDKHDVPKLSEVVLMCSNKHNIAVLKLDDKLSDLNNISKALSFKTSNKSTDKTW